MYTPYAGYVAPYSRSINPTDFMTDGLPNVGQVLAYSTSGGLTWVTPSTAGNFWSLTGNGSTTPGVNFLGTTDANALELHVNGARAFQIVPTGTSLNNFPNIIGGYAGNVVDSGAQGATIGGGGTVGFVNQVSSTLATVAGGSGNVIQAGANDATITGGRQSSIETGSRRCFIGGGILNIVQTNLQGAVIGGGENNTIQGTTDSSFNNNDSTIAGGYGNIINYQSYQSTIAGGNGNNVVDQNYGAIGGGLRNVVGTYDESTSEGGTIPGGENNAVGGFCSFAAGQRAKALHDGAFVWADSQAVDFASTADNQVSFRCLSGVRFTSGTGAANQTVSWTPGSASWSFSSDRNLKDRFAAVDSQSVLERVARLPLAEWSYQGYGQRHIGPMAQDFHALFPLNDDDKMLDEADLHGVGLAAIQALNHKLHVTEQAVKAKDAEILSLEQRLERLEKLVSSPAGQHLPQPLKPRQG